MLDMVTPGSILGMLGNGQLGRMLSKKAAELGFKIKTIGPEGKDSSTGYISWKGWQWDQGSFDLSDTTALDAFAEGCDVMTTEWENVPAGVVEYMAKKEGLVIAPGASVLRVAQDRLKEKQLFESLGLKTADYVTISSREDFEKAKNFIFPARLKTRSGGYDGKDQELIEGFRYLALAFEKLGSKPCILESVIDFDYEVSVVVARNNRGDCVQYPAVVNYHKDGVLRRTIYNPLLIPPEVSLKAVAAAAKVAEYLDAIGVTTLEMFVMQDGTIYGNEVAPRVHNSGHWTQDGCDICQFKMHFHAICNYPIHQPKVLCDSAEMVNILTAQALEVAKQNVGAEDEFLHLYDKEPPKDGSLRKVGHINKIVRQ